LGSERLGRRRFLGGAAGLLVLRPMAGTAQEGVFLAAERAPAQLFPGVPVRSDRAVPATVELQQRVRALLGRAPSLWESAYRIFTLGDDSAVTGFVIIVEEIGKHRPITFAVGVNADGTLHDAAVLAYREAYGGEVRERRFLRQLAGHSLADPLLPHRDLINIAGATLSVAATGRAARKAIAVLKASGALT
jgi:FMN-binding domain